MKKLIFILLGILITYPAFPISTQYTYEGKTLWYTVLSEKERTVEVMSHNNETSGDLKIPSTIEYNYKVYKVTSIGSSAFSGFNELTSVEIPNSVTTIGSSAFIGCNGLTSLTIPNTVTTIGSSAFNNCSSLTSITIPHSVTSIGSFAFACCYGLTSLTIPNSVTTIDRSAFEMCSSLTSVTISNSVTEIAPSTFSYCISLTSVTIPNSVTSISEGAFSNCSGLTSVTIPNSVTSIGDYAFYECSGLTSVTIPNSVSYIGTANFTGCSITVNPGNQNYCSKDGVLFDIDEKTIIAFPANKNTYIIPNTVTSIGDYGFYGCRDLASVTIPNSVTDIGDEAFSYCTDLKEVIISDGSETLSFGSNVFDETSIETLYLGRNFKCTTSTVSDYPFYNKTSLTKLTIGNSVTSIGEKAFDRCSGLKEVIISDGSETLRFGNNVFNDAPIETIYLGRYFKCTTSPFSSKTSQIKLTIGDSVTSIGDYAFWGCTGLTSVTIPNSVTTIGDCAFRGCSGLKEVVISDGSKSLYFGGNVFKETNIETLYVGRDFFKDYTGFSNDWPFYNLTSLTNLTISNTVTNLSSCAFYGCSGLTSVTIPNSVTSIWGSAFSHCSGLTSLVIPKTVSLIHHSAFYGCSGLKEVIISDASEMLSFGSDVFKETSIETLYLGRDFDIGEFCNQPFYNQTSLKSLTISDSVTSINSSAFSRCNGLTSVSFGNSVTSIGNYAFSDCSSLTSVNIGNSVTSIGDNAFYGCTGLTSVNLGNSATSIGGYAFSGCSGLTSVNFGNSVTSIGEDAFSDCRGLTTLIIPNSVTSIGLYAFSGCSRLKEVIIEDGSETLEVGKSVFDKVTSIESLYIGRNYIDRNFSCAFANNPSLTSLTIGNSVTKIIGDSFSSCSGLTSVTIGNSVTEIGKDAFYNCPIDSVFITDLEAWCNIKIYNEAANPLWRCNADLYLNGEKVVNLEIPKSIEELTSMIFIGCSSIETVKFPEGFKFISGKSNFMYCKNLKEVYIPSTTTGINGDYNFACCPSLETFYCYAVIPPIYRYGDRTFEGSYIENITLHVPKGTKERYAAADIWKDFGTIIDDLPANSGVEEIIIDDSYDLTDSNDDSIEVYDLQGMRMKIGNPKELKSLAQGVYILRHGNKTTKISIK